MPRPFIVLSLCAAAMLAGCVTPLPPVAATRFHRIEAASPLAPGSYAFRDDAALDLSQRPDPSFAAAVTRQLDLLGHRSAAADAAGDADYIVDMSVASSEREVRGGSPVSVGVGGATGSYGSGVGVGVGVNLNSLFGNGNGTLVTTRLSVRLTRRGEDTPVWEGRAESQTRAGTPAAQAALNADKLAVALFQGFPGTSGNTISVP